MTLPKVPVDDGADFVSIWSGSELAIPVEFDGAGGRNIFTIIFRTNTNTEVYSVNIFGLLFNAETLARQVGAHMPDIFYGVR